MIGDLLGAFVTVLRSADVVKKNDVTIQAIQDGYDGMAVNCPLPAVIITNAGTIDEPINFIGSGIMDKWRFVLSIMTEFQNPSFSADNNAQVNALNLGIEIRKFLEQGRGEVGWMAVNQKYAMSYMYAGYKQTSTRALLGDENHTISVYNLTYTVATLDMSRLPSTDNGTLIPVEKFNFDCRCTKLKNGKSSSTLE